MSAPTLPGEVWRSKSGLYAVNASGFVHVWLSHTGEWRMAWSERDVEDSLRAWALHERARAEQAEVLAAPLLLRQKAIAAIAARGGEEDWEDVGWMIDDAIDRAHQAAHAGRDVDEAWEEWARDAGASQEAADDVEPVFRAASAALRALGVDP